MCLWLSPWMCLLTSWISACLPPLLLLLLPPLLLLLRFLKLLVVLLKLVDWEL